MLAKSNGIILKIIDHKEIFRGYEKYLPMFNSCSIQTMIYRIPNLSEKFILFNDDTMIMRQSEIKDFFINDMPIIRGEWNEFNENRKIKNIYNYIKTKFLISRNNSKISFKVLQQNSAKLAGTKKYLRRKHTPCSIRKSTISKFFNANEKLLHKNLKYRFRNNNQFVISSLSEHLEIMNNNYKKKMPQLTYFRSYNNYIATKIKLIYFLLNKNKLFVTFQSLEMANKITIKYILKWIEDRLK